MSNETTKGCNLTEREIKELIAGHGNSVAMGEEATDHIERMKYLNSRLKSFKELDLKEAKDVEMTPKDTSLPAPPAGWGAQA